MKTNTKHTPGPWNYSASHPRITKHVFGGYIIPDVCEVETEANARLIAAAPSLLSELTDLEGFVRKFGDSADCAAFMRSAEGYLQAARLAIAKAKGTT